MLPLDTGLALQMADRYRQILRDKTFGLHILVIGATFGILQFVEWLELLEPLTDIFEILECTTIWGCIDVFISSWKQAIAVTAGFFNDNGFLAYQLSVERLYRLEFGLGTIIA